ncbi:histidine kinase [Kribbella steppae]|uniref:Oxygen sensor histidine kinase NreB n=1 Tax=Kribbella steppae TaxID=2512223 RepID=A0A4R2HJX2_9ACTN|nr:GAF domain-containing protein [Kribbella steppae]TCO28075.1 histidine kinase [Kribbella steppae]
MGNRPREAVSPDVLLRLDEEYASILALLDRAAAMQRIVTRVPQLTGVDVAWVGRPDGADRLVLQHTVNIVTEGVDGLVVPIGTGLGGQVFAQRRPLWVRDYGSAPDITHHFRAQAEAEGVIAMIAVPILHDGGLLGVLYGANRRMTDFGDRTAGALEQLATRTAAAQVVAERARHAAEVAVHEERRRVALELHDSVGAMLFTLRAGLQRLCDEPALDEAVRTRLTVLDQHATEASAALRGSLQVLSAPPEQVALCVALREHCRAFQDRTGVNTRVITLTELPNLPRSRIGTLANAAREALLNVEKHARAQSVVVSVFALREGVAMTVSDDGVGLESDPHSAGGLGLAAMSEQVARVGGTVTIGRNDDAGVTFQAWVPR